MKGTHQLLAIATALGFGQPAWGAAITVPNALSDTEGTYQNKYPFTLGNATWSMRYQQVYAASEFASLAAGGELITEIRFRPDPFFGVGPFSVTIPDIQIDLSTTSAAPDGLSLTFDNNVGSDNTVVFPRGPLSISTAVTGPSTGPKTFDVIIPLTTPFLYRPADGNLLLDVRNFGGGVFSTVFDAQRVVSDSVSRLWASEVPDLGNVNQATARDSDTGGLVTQFVTVVPEPTVISGLMVAGVFLLTRCRMV